MITKAAAGYLAVSPGSAQCANCVMFKSGSCDIVAGLIEPYAVCAYWEANPGSTMSVGEYLENGQRDVTPGL